MFELLGQIAIVLNESELEDQPCQIFNLDESGFPLSPKPPKVAARKGEKHPVCITSNEKTVITCVSAGGYGLPPLVIFDQKFLKPEMTSGEVPGTMGLKRYLKTGSRITFMLIFR